MHKEKEQKLFVYLFSGMNSRLSLRCILVDVVFKFYGVLILTLQYFKYLVVASVTYFIDEHQLRAFLVYCKKKLLS